MDEPLDEAAVEAFIHKFKAADLDKKVDQVQLFGLRLEATPALPPHTLDALTLLLAPTLRSPHHLLLQSTLLSLLPTFIPHLTLPHLHLALIQFLPPLVEKLNDPKDRIQKGAAGAIVQLGKKAFEAEHAASASSSNTGTGAGTGIGTGTHGGKGKEKETLGMIWERNVKDALGAKGHRSKVEGMRILRAMREAEAPAGGRMGLKPWLGALVELLEDGDGSVRDMARETVIALFSLASTPPGARAELKKLIAARGVRKTIADSIINGVFNPGPIPAGNNGTDGGDEGGPAPAPALAARSRAASPAGDDIPRVYIASAKDMENEFSKMLPYFLGKEDEHNWNPREKSVIHIRGMLRGQAFQQYPETFIAGLRAGLADGVSRTVQSLRTTVAQQSAALILELAETLGSSLDPFVDCFLPVLAKMAGYTKRIVAEKSQQCLKALIVHTTVPPRSFITTIHAGIFDKSIYSRQAFTSHLKTFCEVQAPIHRHQIETHGLLDPLVEALKKALGDVNPGVRELARLAFWAFNGIWPAQAGDILKAMDTKARKEVDKVNPGLGLGLGRGLGNSEDVAAPAAIKSEAGSSTGERRPSLANGKKAGSASSGMAAMLAEKRRALALASGNGNGNAQRVVSSPVPSSPSLPQGMPRSTSSVGVPTTTNTADEPASASTSSPSRLVLSPQRAQLGQLHSQSYAAVETPTRSTKPQHATPLTTNDSPSRIPPPSPKFQTPNANSKSKPHPQSQSQSPPTQQVHTHTPDERVVHDAQAAQAAQGLMSAQQLLEMNDDDDDDADSPPGPVTPLRAGVDPYKTPSRVAPAPGHTKLWEDSPGVAITPLMIEKLKEKRYERSWWVKRQQYLDKASPLKPIAPSPASAIEPDIESLQSGKATMRNLQKLTLFSSSHPVTEDAEEAIRVPGKVFMRIWEGLMAFLRPDQNKDILEQALVLLWEMVMHQWTLVEGREAQLMDTLFTLRTSRNPTIIESTNSLLSLLTETSEPVYLLGIIRSSLEKYLPRHLPAGSPGGSASLPGRSLSSELLTGEHARSSGWVFGLSGLALCLQKLGEAGVEVEGRKLEGLVVQAIDVENLTQARQAGYMVILSIQLVLRDSRRTLSLVSKLPQFRKDFATYLMEQNGILHVGDGNGGGDEAGVVLEMEKLMSNIT